MAFIKWTLSTELTYTHSDRWESLIITTPSGEEYEVTVSSLRDAVQNIEKNYRMEGREF